MAYVGSFQKGTQSDIYILSNSRKNEQTGWVTVTINLTANSNPTGKRGRVD